jgi:hypothetical protein
MRIVWTVLALAVLPLSNCSCDEPLQTLAPILQIGDPYREGASVCRTDLVRDCSYTFGEPVGVGAGGSTFAFTLDNPSPVPLHIESIVMEDGSSPAFTFDALDGVMPTFVEASGRQTISVRFDPAAAEPATAVVAIASDAENLAPDEEVRIALAGEGRDLGAPAIEVTPPACEFGDVAVGATAFCDLSVKNVGEIALSITGAGWTEGTPAPAVFGSATVLAVPTILQVQEATTVRLYATPDGVTPAQGGLVLESNDPVTPALTVPLSVSGTVTASPTAVARVKTVNGVPPTVAAPTVEPLDDVVLSGDQSQPGSPGGRIVAYAWEIVEQPAESVVELRTPTAADTGFVFSASIGDVHGVDVAGTFVVRLTVTDDAGETSTNDARVTLNAVPGEGLHVQLTWDGVGDIDLHLARGLNTDWCDAFEDCYFGNCTSGLNWAAGVASDPRLDIDNIEAFGPENINIDVPLTGSYLIGVDYWAGTRLTAATVRIFTNGALALERTTQLTSPDDLWTVARVDVDGSVVTVTPVDDVSLDFSCDPFIF